LLLYKQAIHTENLDVVQSSVGGRVEHLDVGTEFADYVQHTVENRHPANNVYTCISMSQIIQ